jgi:hypothetical protein
MQADLAEKIGSTHLPRTLAFATCTCFSSSRRSQTADISGLDKLYVAHWQVTENSAIREKARA